MRKIIGVLLFFCYLSAQAQDKPLVLPRDENGKVLFSEVIQADSMKATTLYGNAKLWFANTFKSAKDVIQVDDKEAGRVVGKAWQDIYIKVLGMPSQTKLWFSISVQVKDGRYKIEMYDLKYEQYPSQHDRNPQPQAVESWFTVESYYKNNGKARSINESYKEETEKAWASIKASLVKNMVSKKSSDW